ncbi:MAG: 3-keto-disaccharide hydrolase, partial [Limisphaerales bacterium]
MQKKIKSEQWNDYRIVAKGNHLQHFINGVQTVDVIDQGPGNAKSGILALQIHVGPPMIVQFKNIRLKKL